LRQDISLKKLTSEDDHNLDARELLKSASWGVLSTHSVEYEGYPFGSVVPYALTDENEPIILISTMAQHTKNIISDNKISLIITGGEDTNVQANARLTYLGKAQQVPEDKLQAISNKYLIKFPASEKYFKAHSPGTRIDFKFYKVKLTAARYIGGFGRIFWLNYEALKD